MAETTSSREFGYTVSGEGPASGMRFSGLSAGLDGAHGAVDVPLIIALPGGTYTSKYFDVPGYSLLERSAALGIPIIALDRPGYVDSTPVSDEGSIILNNAEVLDQVIGELWNEYGAGLAGVVIIAHSIGGAVATAVAARNPSWPLLGISLSGCLLRVPGESRAAWEALPEIPFIDLPSPMKDQVMFGPAWTYAEGMPAASHITDAPVPRAELLDITGTWIEHVREHAAKVTVPVLHRQAEYDALWITDQSQIDEFRTIFTASPDVDTRIQPSTGHCIDFHREGPAFQVEELAFALRCAIPHE